MSAPVQNTCPDIDKAIKLINAAIKSAKDGRKNFPDADDNFYYIISDLGDLEGMLEDLRRDNSKLRDWGYEKHVRLSFMFQKHILETFS